MAIRDVLTRLARDWASPRQPGNAPFPLRCSLRDGPAQDAPDGPLPTSLAELWRHTSGARLFEDVSFGQWGLALLSPAEALFETSTFEEERAREHSVGDLVVGRFLGDQEQLIVRCDPVRDDFGAVLIALPLDRRREWYRAADDLELFLLAYERAAGDKFWESR